MQVAREPSAGDGAGCGLKQERPPVLRRNLGDPSAGDGAGCGLKHTCRQQRRISSAPFSRRRRRLRIETGQLDGHALAHHDLQPATAPAAD